MWRQPAALSAEFRKVHQFNVFTVNTPAQHGLAAYMAQSAPYLGLPAFLPAQSATCSGPDCKIRAFRLLPADGTYFQCVDYTAILGFAGNRILPSG